MNAIGNQVTRLSADHSKLARLILDEQKKKIQAAKVEAQHERVAAGVMTVQLLSRVVLKNSPDAQYKISSGVKSIGAIADAVIELRRDGLRDGAKVLLSGNIANAALALVGLFGPMGKDPTIALLESGFASVRQDIKQLREEMHDRFDRVDRALDTIYSSMQTRFSEIDDRLDIIYEGITKLTLNQKQLHQVSIDAFAALLSHDYKLQFQTCLSPEAVNYLDYGAYARCLAAVAQYGADDAANDVFTGTVFFDPSLQPEQAAQSFDAHDPDYLRGILAASLRSKAALLGPGATAILRNSPSPMAWSGAVDTYINIRNLAPQLKKAGPIKIVPLTDKSLKKLKQSGIELAESIAAIRQYGAAVALDIYERDALLAAKPLAKAVMDRLPRMELGTVEEIDYREAFPIWFDNGNGLDFDLVRGAQLAFKDGPDKGKPITTPVTKVRVQTRRVVSGVQATKGNVNWLATLVIPNALKDDVNYSLSTYGPLEITPSESIVAAVAAANVTYLSKAKMTTWPPTAVSALTSTLKELSGSTELKSACAKMAESKRYLDALVMLYRVSPNVKKEPWVVELESLPAGSDDDANCEDLARFALQGATFPEAKDELGIDVLISFIGDRLKLGIANFRKEYAKASMSDGFPEVQLRLSRLERCIINKDPVCS